MHPMSCRKHVFRALCFNPQRSIFFMRWSSSVAKPETSNVEKIRQKRNDLFSEEKQRQLKWVARIEKIEVEVYGRTADNLESEEKLCTLAMNKDLSTPYNCALHISEHVARRSALALVDGKPWDMHRPLTSNCQVKFLYFTDANPSLVNNVFWRSCSFLLGYVLETSFTDSHSVRLHSWPAVSVNSGSFVYDVQMDEGLLNWKPTTDELRTLSRAPTETLRLKRAPFEPLTVDVAVAQKIFEDNPLKLQQLPSIAELSPVKGQIPLYRAHDHVDISRGPMISNTEQFGFFNVCAFYPHDTKDFGRLCRVQGVSVPFTQRVNSWAWEIVCRAAKRPSTLPVPSLERYQTAAPKTQEKSKPVAN